MTFVEKWDFINGFVEEMTGTNPGLSWEGLGRNTPKGVKWAATEPIPVVEQDDLLTGTGIATVNLLVIKPSYGLCFSCNLVNL